MRIRWTPKAADDLQDIYAYFADGNLARASEVVRFLYAEIMLLKRFPRLGSAWFGHEFELLLTPLPFRCVYRLDPEAVIILRIQHTARQPEPSQ